MGGNCLITRAPRDSAISAVASLLESTTSTSASGTTDWIEVMTLATAFSSLRVIMATVRSADTVSSGTGSDQNDPESEQRSAQRADAVLERVDQAHVGLVGRRVDDRPGVGGGVGVAPARQHLLGQGQQRPHEEWRGVNLLDRQAGPFDHRPGGLE